MPTTLTLTDFQQAATRLKTGVAEIKAVTEVESNGRGFDSIGRIIIRFEPHKFHEYTKGKYDGTHPSLSFPQRRKNYPVDLNQSWDLYNIAKTLDLTATRLATSFGMFQILGSNFPSCGCKTVGEFVTKMCKSEATQLDLFCRLLLDWRLDDELRNHQWATFAKFYNGAGFKQLHYDTKLQDAYQKHL